MAHVPRPGHTRRTHGRVARSTHSHDSFDVPLVANQDFYDQVLVDESGQVTQGGIAPGAVGSGHIAPGAIVDLTPFASNLRPVAIVDSLPTLPDDEYPEFSYVVLTTDERLYKNIGDVWVLGVDGADIVADSITAGAIAAGAINAEEIAAGAITVEKLALEDESGQTLLDAQGFGPTWIRFIQSGVYNGDFASPSPSLVADFHNDTNPLPNWDYSQVSGTAVTGRSVVDATSPTGFVARFSMASGLAGDRSYISQKVPISQSRSSDFVVHARATVRATADSLATAAMQTILLDKNFGILTSTTTTEITLTTINADPENVKVLSVTYSGDDIPSNAAYVFVQVGLQRSGASAGSTATLDVLDVRVENPRGDIRLADNEDPTKGNGHIFKAGGSLWIRVNEGDGDPAIEISDGGPVTIYGDGTFSGEMRLAVPGGSFRIDPGSQVPVGTPLHHSASLAYSSSASLPAAGGSRAIPMVVLAPINLSGYQVYCTDTASARSAQLRLYRDVGSNTFQEIPQSDATLSFTPGSAAIRTALVSSATSIPLGPGIYWLIVRNSHATNTFGIGFTSAASSTFPVTANLSKDGVASLGATIGMTGWNESSAIFAVLLWGNAGTGSIDFDTA